MHSEDSEFLPLPSFEDGPIHSTPVKSSIPPFSTKRSAHKKESKQKYQQIEAPPPGTPPPAHHHHQNHYTSHTVPKSHDHHYPHHGSPARSQQQHHTPKSIPRSLEPYFTDKTPPRSQTYPQLQQIVTSSNKSNHSNGRIVTEQNISVSASPPAVRKNYQTISPVHKGSRSTYNHSSPVYSNPVVSGSPHNTSNTEQFSLHQKTNVAELENSTIHKQRTEIQLLVAELQDRDRELNDMVSAHQHQLMAWEQDRQRLLILEQKCASYQEQVQQRTRQLRTVTSQLKATKNESQSQNSELETTQDRLADLEEENSKQYIQLQEYEDKNLSLNTSIKEMSSVLGQLQAKEQEMATMLKLKEKDLSTATDHMRELSDRLKQLDKRNKECQDREVEAVKQSNLWKQKYTDIKQQLDQSTKALKNKGDELQQKLSEIGSIKEKTDLLQKEYSQRDKCKDELIESMKLKQNRTDQQLRHLRELYERQQREVTLLQLNLDSSKEIIHKQQNSIEELSSSRSSCTCSKSHSRITADLSPQQSINDSPRQPRKISPDKNKSPNQNYVHSDRQSVFNPDRISCETRIHDSYNFPKQLQEQDSIPWETTLSEKRETTQVSTRQQVTQQENHAYTSFGSPRGHYNEQSEISPRRVIFSDENRTENQSNRKMFQTQENFPADFHKNMWPKDRNNPETFSGSPERSKQVLKRSFEERLSTFLDSDLDDSILEDDGSGRREVGRREIEESPATKLQNLLLESRMMIQKLEKSSNSENLNISENNTTDVIENGESEQKEKEEIKE